MPIPKQFDFGQYNAYAQAALILAVDKNQIDTIMALLASDHADVNQFNLQAIQRS